MLGIGGGATGAEMAQAFSRLGCRTTILQMDTHLLPFADFFAGELLEDPFHKEDIAVYNIRSITSVSIRDDGSVILGTEE